MSLIRKVNTIFFSRPRALLEHLVIALRVSYLNSMNRHQNQSHTKVRLRSCRTAAWPLRRWENAETTKEVEEDFTSSTCPYSSYHSFQMHTLLEAPRVLLHISNQNAISHCGNCFFLFRGMEKEIASVASSLTSGELLSLTKPTKAGCERHLAR